MTAQQWISGIVENIVNIVIWPVFVGAVVIMFIWAGFLFLTSKGEPAKLLAAQKAFIWAVVGVAVGIIAFSAVATIQYFIPI